MTLDHPTNTDIERCVPVTQSRFRVYANSADAGFTSLAWDYASTQGGSDIASSLTHSRSVTTKSSPSRSLNIDSLLTPANSTNTEARSSQGHLLSIDTCTTLENSQNLLHASQKRELQQTGQLSEIAPPVKRPRTPQAHDAQLVETTITWLKEGLLSKSFQSFEGLATQPRIEAPPPQEGQSYAWFVGFIAACSLLVGTKFALPAASVSGSLELTGTRVSPLTMLTETESMLTRIV